MPKYQKKIREFDLTKEDDYKEPQGAKEVIKSVLYTKEGADAFHAGNPFALAFNKALNA